MKPFLFAILIVFVGSCFGNKLIDSCHSCSGCYFEDFAKCLTIRFGHIAHFGARSQNKVLKYIISQSQIIKYQFFKRCKEECCFNDTMAFDIKINDDIDSDGNVKDISSNKSESKYQDTILFNQVKDIVKSWNFGKRARDLIAWKPSSNHPPRVPELTLILIFTEPKLIRFTTPIFDQ
jgi:hypothetical protein